MLTRLFQKVGHVAEVKGHCFLQSLYMQQLDAPQSIGKATGEGESCFFYPELLLNLGCSFALTPVGCTRVQVGLLDHTHADKDKLQEKIKGLSLHWPFGLACNVDWRR